MDEQLDDELINPPFKRRRFDTHQWSYYGTETTEGGFYSSGTYWSNSELVLPQLENPGSQDNGVQFYLEQETPATNCWHNDPQAVVPQLSLESRFDFTFSNPLDSVIPDLTHYVTDSEGPIGMFDIQTSQENNTSHSGLQSSYTYDYEHTEAIRTQPPREPFATSYSPVQYLPDKSQQTASCFSTITCSPKLPPRTNPPFRNDSRTSVSEENTKDDELLCFGMVQNIKGECQFPPGTTHNKSRQVLSVKLDSTQTFISWEEDIKGKISHQYVAMFEALLEESSIDVELTCHIIGDVNLNTRKASSSIPRMVPCHLSLIVYGPSDLFDDIGGFFQDYDMYLQDPNDCGKDVKYYNPHRLSSADLSSCPMTSAVRAVPGAATAVEELPRQSEALDLLDSHEALAEAAQPVAIRTPLKSHQKQALTFMLERERGWTFEPDKREVWEMRYTTRGYYFINRISSIAQPREPMQFRGGIIADPMGLGKTLTMIALIATDERQRQDSNLSFSSQAIENEMASTTLIIVPPPLLDTWEEQLAQHVVNSKLRWIRHHSKSRLSNMTDLDHLDVVLTTYHTVSAEWRNDSDSQTSLLFRARWKRVILDEAHIIRNSSSRTAKAVRAIQALCRWAVTGTPIQNRLSDLAALLKFLHIDPYSDSQRFDTDITQLWKSGQAAEAVNRLKRLASCILLRRPKATINLPKRKDLSCAVEFNAEERALYNELKFQTISRIQDDQLDSRHPSNSAAFVNVIQQINSLRMMCSMGLHYNVRHVDSERDIMMENRSWSENAQHAFNFKCESEPVNCQLCASSLSEIDAMGGGSQHHFSHCLRLICSYCMRTQKTATCGHAQEHQLAVVSTNWATMEEPRVTAASLTDRQPSMASMGLPSKVATLITQLKSKTGDIKSIVFSTWRMTLDIVEDGIKQAGINYVRFDGKVPQKERQAVINKFRQNPSVKVMLLTLSCGAVGLTLTEASYAYLMEPHWNPTIEEQALARIHRLGQKNEVTTVRFFVRDTFEQRVMTVQESKKDLASALLSAQDGGQGVSESRLEWLCNLL